MDDAAPINERAVLGGNNPPLVDPDILAQSLAKVAAFSAKATEWLALGEITTAQQSGNLVDFISGARAVLKRIDEARVAAKKPHDEAVKAVQAIFAPMMVEIDRSIDRLKPLQTAWLRKEQARLEAIQAAQRAESQRLRIAAEEAAAIAVANNSIGGEVEAERLAKEAAALEKAGNREVRAAATSASGAGRTMANRLIKTARIDNIRVAFMAVQSHASVIDAIQRALNEMVRAKGFDGAVIPGATIITTETAA